MNARAEFVTIFMPVTPAMRARLEATIDALVGLLDEIDGDPDFETASDDEPCLGWSYSVDGVPLPSASASSDDRELDGDDELSDIEAGA